MRGNHEHKMEKISIVPRVQQKLRIWELRAGRGDKVGRMGTVVLGRNCRGEGATPTQRPEQSPLKHTRRLSIMAMRPRGLVPLFSKGGFLREKGASGDQ